jgi:putative transposase
MKKKLLSEEQLRAFIKENKLVTVADAQEALKDLFGEMLQHMLEAELDNELGYSRYDYKNKNTGNCRNGHSRKKVKTELGGVEIKVPRDRQGEFAPTVVKKHQTDVSSIENQVISMYAKGMSVRDIQGHLERIYGIEASPTLISNITDKILPIIREWQNRPLQPAYAFLFIDAIHYSVRQESRVLKKAAHMVIGVDLDGHKDVLGIWIGENESARFWLSVLTDLRNRGVKDILILSVDNLSGISEAIAASFPEVQIQKCIVHQIRNSTRYISYKDLKSFTTDLKTVYRAANETEAFQNLNLLEEKWGSKYPLAIRSWRNNWLELSTFFNYPQEIRKIIYTTNVIEAYHRQLRKVTKAKSIFPSDESLMKMLYLATMDVVDKWTMRIPNWGLILAQLTVIFGERVEKQL